jgi:hypothetical protein
MSARTGAARDTKKHAWPLGDDHACWCVMDWDEAAERRFGAVGDIGPKLGSAAPLSMTRTMANHSGIGLIASWPFRDFRYVLLLSVIQHQARNRGGLTIRA